MFLGWFCAPIAWLTRRSRRDINRAGYPALFFGVIYMRPTARKPVSKGKSAAKFRRQSNLTKGANIAPPPNRGGYRF